MLRTRAQFKPWMVGFVYLPFGLYNGFVAAAMPLLLTSRGVPLETVGGIAFIVMLPSFLSFLLTPLVDCGMQRRSWAILLACICAASLVTSFLLLDDAAHSASARALLTAALTLGYLAGQMYSSSIGGMLPNALTKEQLPTASTLLNMAFLGGTGIGGTIAVFAITRLPRMGAAAALAAEVLLPMLFLFLAKEQRTPHRFADIVRVLPTEFFAAVRVRHVWMGFIIFATPAAAFVAINYFGGMGPEFHASLSQTAWITGTGVAVLSCLGTILSAFLLRRFEVRTVVIVPGALSALATLGMAFGPRTAWTFLIGVGFYALMAGINYVAATELAFELIGPNHPLSSTLYSVLIASSNVALEIMVLCDKHAAGIGGVHALLITDGCISATCGILLMVLVKTTDRAKKISHATVEVA